MVWVRFPGEKLSPISNPKHLEFPRFSGSEEEADEEWNGLGDEEQDQKRWRWCVGRRCLFFFWLIWDCLLLYNLCTVYIYIHIHCIYLCFFGVGGRLGMNPRIDMQRSRSIIEYVFSINECTTSSVWNEQLKPKIQPDSATLSSVWTSPRWTMNT